MSKEKQHTTRIPVIIWVILVIMAATIVYLLIQDNQTPLVESPPSAIEQKPSTDTQQQANETDASRSKSRSRPKRPDIKNTLKNRKKYTLELPAEDTGQRMFEELKTVTGDNRELLNVILAQLLEESAQQKKLEQMLKDGEITKEAFWDEVYELRLSTETTVEDILEPLQFDRYREVRQSWSKGRIHPDRDSRE